MSVKDSEFAVMKQMLTEIHKEMMGNGQPGMIKEFETVKRHANHIPDILTYINKNKGMMKALSVVIMLLALWQGLSSFIGS